VIRLWCWSGVRTSHGQDGKEGRPTDAFWIRATENALRVGSKISSPSVFKIPSPLRILVNRLVEFIFEPSLTEAAARAAAGLWH